MRNRWVRGIFVLALLGVTGLSFASVAVAEEDSADVAKIRVIETNWAEALVKKDQYALDLSLAPTFVDISASGEVTTKNQQIAHLYAPNYGVLAYTETLTSVRVLGETAIAQGTYTLRRKWGSDVQEERGVFTHVYQRVRDSWQCINAQRTIVREQVGPPKSAEKKSELPFHIPFTGGGKKQQQQEDPSPVTVMPTPQQPTVPPAQPAATQAPAPTPDPQDAPPPTLQNVK
jgi:ketosteroid isomerase-like protein